jgi:predicted RNA-binding Zn ribbon-like protein
MTGVFASSWAPDDETKPAPRPLLLLQSFVNTWEGDSGIDLLADQEVGPPPWLQESGLLRGPDIDLAVAREIRETIRSLLVAKTGEPDVKPDLRGLRALADDVRLRPVVRDDGTVDLQAGGDGPAFLAANLLLIIRDAQRNGTWARLKACRNPDCSWAFYDRSHAGRGAWCDMAVCGNRIKNRNLRTRRSGWRAGAPEAAS